MGGEARDKSLRIAISLLVEPAPARCRPSWHVASRRAPRQRVKWVVLAPLHTTMFDDPFDDFCLPDDVLAAVMDLAHTAQASGGAQQVGSLPHPPQQPACEPPPSGGPRLLTSNSGQVSTGGVQPHISPPPNAGAPQPSGVAGGAAQTPVNMFDCWDPAGPLARPAAPLAHHGHLVPHALPSNPGAAGPCNPGAPHPAAAPFHAPMAVASAAVGQSAPRADDVAPQQQQQQPPPTQQQQQQQPQRQEHEHEHVLARQRAEGEAHVLRARMQEMESSRKQASASAAHLSLPRTLPLPR
eukprot:3141569-Prymnesium_polylepis.1